MDFLPPIVTNNNFYFQRQVLESKKNKGIADREGKKENHSCPPTLAFRESNDKL